jgi:hypothetical protein
MFSLLRPKPSKFLEMSLPLYFSETDKCINAQALSMGELFLGNTDTLAECVAIGRSLNIGCAVSAHKLAKDLSGIPSSGGERAYELFRTSLDKLIFENLDESIARIFLSDPRHFLDLSHRYQAKVNDLTNQHFVNDSDIEKWQVGLGTLYADVTNKFSARSTSTEIKIDDLRDIQISYCVNFGKQSYSMLNTITNELESLMRAKKSVY